MSAESPWTPVLSVGSGLEADIARAALEAEGIPVLVRGHNANMFGGAFQGPVIGGLELLVPGHAVHRAREILALDEA